MHFYYYYHHYFFISFFIYFLFFRSGRWINLNMSLKSQNVPSKVVFKLQFIKTPKIFTDPVSIQLFWIQVHFPFFSSFLYLSEIDSPVCLPDLFRSMK